MSSVISPSPGISALQKPFISIWEWLRICHYRLVVTCDMTNTLYASITSTCSPSHYSCPQTTGSSIVRPGGHFTSDTVPEAQGPFHFHHRWVGEHVRPFHVASVGRIRLCLHFKNYIFTWAISWNHCIHQDKQRTGRGSWKHGLMSFSAAYQWSWYHGSMPLHDQLLKCSFSLCAFCRVNGHPPARGIVWAGLRYIAWEGGPAETPAWIMTKYTG